jgi:hypothetical protein
MDALLGTSISNSEYRRVSRTECRGVELLLVSHLYVEGLLFLILSAEGSFKVYSFRYLLVFYFKFIIAASVVSYLGFFA